MKRTNPRRDFALEILRVTKPKEVQRRPTVGATGGTMLPGRFLVHALPLRSRRKAL